MIVNIFYPLASIIMRVLLWLFSRWSVEGAENVPATGGVVLASNHLNISDPPLMGVSVRRRIVFMAKEETFHTPGLKWVVQAYGAFPVRRGEVDRRSIKQGLAILRSGGVVGMFPEGHRSPNASLQEGRLGVALFAFHAGVPVVPIAITGTEGFTSKQTLRDRLAGHRRLIHVKIGKPIVLATSPTSPSRKELEEGTQAVMCAIADLLPDSYRGVYGPTAVAVPSRRRAAQVTG
jgi:1-acyl-sn-glycerol-3-phosphate acyltransferase